MRALLRRVGRVLSTSPGAGALFFVLVFIATPWQAGFASFELARDVLYRLYGGFIAGTLVGVFAAHVALGGALGAAAGFALDRWDRALGRTRSRYRALHVVLVLALGLAWQLALTLVRHPQLFARWLYARGGVARALEVALTEHADPRALAAAGWTILGLFLLGPLVATRAQPSRRALGASALAAILVLVASRRAPPAAAAPDPSRPGILLIGIDSLRWDRVDAARMPHIARLASQSVVFAAAHASLPRTYGALTSLLTGRWPQHHGIRSMFPSNAARAAVGPALPRALAARGYATAVSCDEGMNPLRRIDFGFETGGGPGVDIRSEILATLLTRHLALMPLTSTGWAKRAVPPLENDWYSWDPEERAEAVIAALDASAARGPFFVMGFFVTPHLPYAASWPWYRRFTKPGYEGRYRYDGPLLAFEPPTGEDLAQIAGLYDGAIAATDAAVGRVLDALDARGLAERTIVVVFADHGEHLGEYGRGLGHGDHLHGSSAIHVPLMIRAPGLAPRVVRSIVRDVDVAPTLAALAGAKLERADGVDLGPLLRGEKDDLGLDAFTESDQVFNPSAFVAPGPATIPYPIFPRFLSLDGDSLVLAPEVETLTEVVKERSVRSGRFKLVYRPTRRGARLWLHDLERDPEEQVNLAATDAAHREALVAKLYRWMTSTGEVVDDLGIVAPRGFELPR